MWVLKQYRVCLTDGRVRLAAESGSGWPVGPGAGGWWTGLAPDGAILGLRDTSTEEIYSLDTKFP